MAPTLHEQLSGWVLAVAAITLSSVTTLAGQNEYTFDAGADQRVYMEGVPHIAITGQTRTSYDADESFFPTALCVVYDWDENEMTLVPRLPKIKDAAFNTIYYNGPLSDEFLDSLDANNLKIVNSGFNPDEWEEFADHPAILAWDIYDEPDDCHEWERYSRIFAQCQQGRQQIREHDKTHPILTNTTYGIWPNLVWWAKWHQVGDISCHDSYPVKQGDRQTSWSNCDGIPETVSASVAVTGQSKPVWIILQAFGIPYDHPSYYAHPTSQELRSMTYTALVHGVTGIMYFILDSPCARSLRLCGIAPHPPQRYSQAEDQYVATPEQLEQMMSLWEAVGGINGEIQTLKPWLLSPTSQMDYRVYVRGESVSEHPVRTLLKEYEDEYVLLVANVDRAELDVRIELLPQAGLATIRELFAPDAEVNCTATETLEFFLDDSPKQCWAIEEHLEQYAVRVYHFRLAQ